MLDIAAVGEAVSHTRAASLANLAGLCLVLHEQGSPLPVAALAQAAVERGILDDCAPATGGRLPTRTNHHMIALRELLLVSGAPGHGHIGYSLTDAGEVIAQTAEQVYSGSGPLTLDGELREAWRPILAQSNYVRHQWLKYFMPRADFAYHELLTESTPVTIYRVPVAQRRDRDDSGYRIVSDHWNDRELDAIERREIYEGLRRWTNEAWLTDDRLPPDVRGPFAHAKDDAGSVFESASHIVRTWLSPDGDLDVFVEHLDEVLDSRERGNRITIPELIIAMCHDYDYAKQNVKEMLVALYYERGDRYVFERASRFLMRGAFRAVKSDDYYVQIEGVWRTGLVCY